MDRPFPVGMIAACGSSSATIDGFVPDDGSDEDDDDEDFESERDDGSDDFE